MRKIVSLAALLCLALPAAFAAPPAKPVAGTMVITFKDGHRQVINLADIARVEFPVSDTAVASSPGTSRSTFLGKWEVGDGSGGKFFITLYENGDAKRSLHSKLGRWAFVDGEARVTWDDGLQDVIRKVGSGYQKFAYSAHKSVNDTPDNVADAHNTTPHPL